ncbi:unnamed protein product [Parnassius mnemosyne]|uniref:U-box domain-containing protein n=1 Tax=Parnassius mnemosyne TaxID=213953 RepID=A0AAV1KX53_9NEOP
MWEETTEPLLVHTLRAHRGEVSCADVSGGLLATGGGDCALRLWRWQPGAGWAEAGGAVRAHRYGVTAARWAASGALLASAGVDGAARVWSRALVPRRELAAPAAAAARALTWAASRLLVGYDDGVLCIWAVRRGTLLVRLVPCDGALHALTTLARGALLIVACTSGTLKVYDMNEVCASDESVREVLTPLLWEDGAHDLGALCAAANDVGDVAATGGHDARVRLWCVTGEARERRVHAGAVLCGHTAAVTSLHWARGGSLVSASLDRTARLWAPRTLTCLRVLHAHARYLTCAVLSPDLRFLLTGSNDRTVRTWSLGDFKLEDDIEPPCSVLTHFGLGDLEGIEPVNDEAQYDESANALGDDVGFNEAERLWISKDVHVGAINSIATYKDIVVTACSDGAVRIFRWSEQLQTLLCERELAAHRYPAMSVDLGAGGAMLLSAGLDGRARLWDVQSGLELLSLSGESVSGGEAGGGGVRCARVSPHRPPLLLLATDDGALALWRLDQHSSEPIHVYEAFDCAATCCAWAGDGRVCAAGAAGGELRALAPPPAHAPLHAQRDAHDLGVLSCDFVQKENWNESNTYTLASAGRDALVKIWKIQLEDDSCGGTSATMCLLCCLEAHGAAVESVRFGVGDDGSVRLATSGADGWARVWRLASDGRTEALAAVPVGGATGATAAALLGTSVLVAGILTGELTLWRLPVTNEDGKELTDDEGDDGVEPRYWGIAGVAKWLREYITRIPGAEVSIDTETTLVQRARDSGLTGARLLDDPVDELIRLLLPSFKFTENLEKYTNLEDQGEIEEDNKLEAEFEKSLDVSDIGSEVEENKQLRKRLEDELQWLRREPPDPKLETSAPHALRCAMTHALLREPARAADGFSYERANVLDYFFAADGAVSPLTGRRLRSARVVPNLGLRRTLREFLDSASNQ